MEWVPPGSSVHGIPQAKIQEWVAIAFSRGSSQPRDQTQVSSIASSLLSEPPGKLAIIFRFKEKLNIVWPTRGLPRWCQWERTCLPMQETQKTWVQSLGQEDPLWESQPTGFNTTISKYKIPFFPREHCPRAYNPIFL